MLPLLCLLGLGLLAILIVGKPKAVPTPASPPERHKLTPQERAAIELAIQGCQKALAESE